MLAPVGLPGVAANTPAKKSDHNQTATTPVEAAPQPVVEASQAIVLPSNSQSWDDWQQQRVLLQPDKPHNTGTEMYQQIANQPMREQLQQMVGVDLWV